MLGKWFKRKSAPTNNGNSNLSEAGNFHYAKIFELELSNMEDSPVYLLTHQLSIGSEIGNIIVDDPSISPRHATFTLQDEVISVIDHGSVAGTFVNGKKIDAGKKVILEETDIILVGDLEIRIKVGRRTVPKESIPELPSEDEVPEENNMVEELNQAKEEHEEEKKEEQESQQPTPRSVPRVEKKTKKNLSFTSSRPGHATNAVIRVLAVVSDFILSYCVLVIFLPFDEFRQFLADVPELIKDAIGMEWGELLNMAIPEEWVREMITDGFEFLSSTFQIVPLVIVFVFNRLLFTLLFGVSLSELMLGVRSAGNAVWSRLGGLLRVIIGLVTWPFLIFDLPSVVSRRTFKEVLTFTQTYVPSKFISILGIIFYLPLLVAATAFSPLFQGLETPEPIFVNDKLDQRVRVKVAEGETASDETAVGSVLEKSEALHVGISYKDAELSLFPSFKFQGGGNKLRVKSGLVFYQKELQRYAEFEVMKNFDFKQLLGIGMKGNIFLYEKYPEIYNYVYQADDVNIAFKKTTDEKAQFKFANEVMAFTKSALSLSAENAIDFIQTESPILKGIIDFKSSFLSLIEYKDFSAIGFIKIGNVIFMKISYQKQRPFDLLIPLIKGPGRIYKVTFDKKENSGASSNKLYKFDLHDTDWISDVKRERGEVLTALEVYDLFSGDTYMTLLESPDKVQALYAYYYETSASVIKRGDSAEIEIWKSNVQNVLKLFELLPVKEGSEDEENVKAKLLQNMRDTIHALENNNTEYFGVAPVTAV